MFLCLRFWRNMYHQFDRAMHPRQSILKHTLTLKESNKELENTVRGLQEVSRYLLTLLTTLWYTSCQLFSAFSLQKLQKFGLSTSPLNHQNERSVPPRPRSLILGAPVSRKEAQQNEDEEEVYGEEALEEEDDVPRSSSGERTVEGSSASENGYTELQGSFGSKSEPAVVSLEFGVARMTCWGTQEDWDVYIGQDQWWEIDKEHMCECVYERVSEYLASARSAKY